MADMMTKVIGALANLRQTVDSWDSQLNKHERSSIESIQRVYQDKKWINNWQGYASLGLAGVSGLLGIGAARFAWMDTASSVLRSESASKAMQSIFGSMSIEADGKQSLETRNHELVRGMIGANQSFWTSFCQSVQSIQQTKSQQSN